MRDLSVRATDAEWMDGADVSPDTFAACVASLARVNTVTLARPPTLAWLTRATRSLGPNAAFRLVDVGFGDGDMLRAIRRWATRRGFRADLIGYDLNPRGAAAANARTDPASNIAFRTGDAFACPEPIDFVVSSLTAHHMTDGELVAFLRWMEATSRRGWFINDLHRHPLAYHGFKVIAWIGAFHPFVRHDGPISVARAFRRADWLGLLKRAGIAPAAVNIAWRFPFRLCVGRLK